MLERVLTVLPLQLSGGGVVCSIDSCSRHLVVSHNCNKEGYRIVINGPMKAVFSLGHALCCLLD